MNGPNIIALVIYIFCSLIMISIGVYDLKSKKPCGFYSGERPPSKEELTDWKEWNRRHGRMWIIYGIIIMVSFFLGMPFEDSLFCLIPFTAGMLVPVPIMIHLHNKYLKEFKK